MARWFRTPLDYPPQGTRVRFAEWPDLGWELVDIGAEPSARDSPAECAGEARGWGVREAPQGEGGARVALVEKVALAEQVGERPPARRRLDTETPAA